MTHQDKSYVLGDEERVKRILLSINDILIKQFKDREHVPVFTSTEISNISDCILRADQELFGSEIYKTFSEKVSFIFYSVNKNHYLENGNKRTAFLLIMFCIVDRFKKYINDDMDFFLKKIITPIANKGIEIAESDPKDSINVLKGLVVWFDNLLNNSD
ncbi:MAG: Fic family protein [Cyanobium sp. MAG06]|nr:Fic family protein [Cyanobium sp. MAG06]